MKCCGTCYFVISDGNKHKEQTYVCSITKELVSPLGGRECFDYQHYVSYNDCFESPLNGGRNKETEGN